MLTGDGQSGSNRQMSHSLEERRGISLSAALGDWPVTSLRALIWGRGGVKGR